MRLLALLWASCALGAGAFAPSRRGVPAPPSTLASPSTPSRPSLAMAGSPEDETTERKGLLPFFAAKEGEDAGPESSVSKTALFVSQETKRVLVEELGYKRAEAERLRPEMAGPIVKKRTRRPEGGVPEDWLMERSLASMAAEDGGEGGGIKPLSLLPWAAGVFAAGSIGIHAGAWSSFFASLAEMKAAATPEDFGAALNFWIFFAAGHPILQPILWISDVLHGTPGPQIADLVPVLFIAGNVAAIYAFAAVKEVRNAVNIAVLGAFLGYVGAGLDGTAGLGDFNLALDDQYQGKIVKGCPAYPEVRQPSMDNFNLEKYQGKWYEHKFHDWTQFKEVYDTTLDIRLTPDGKGWIDDFAVKGPAPKAAPLSWDKSPVAEGAHYFLFGRVDDRDPPGVLRESGFGVEFPNYIVDVTKDEKGEYKEAIQFQCLERGGVRVFEGINFMSRSPTMTDAELTAMHGRAEKAGMYPYGASPEQMHQVARRPLDAPKLDNSWQRMWHAIGVDKLLELLTESIEDGGR